MSCQLRSVYHSVVLVACAAVHGIEQLVQLAGYVLEVCCISGCVRSVVGCSIFHKVVNGPLPHVNGKLSELPQEHVDYSIRQAFWQVAERLEGPPSRFVVLFLVRVGRACAVYEPHTDQWHAEGAKQIDAEPEVPEQTDWSELMRDVIDFLADLRY